MKKKSKPIDKEDNSDFYKDNDNKKIKALEYINQSIIKQYVSSFQSFYFKLFNKKSKFVRMVFYLLLSFSILEKYILNKIDVFLIRASISLIFFIPCTIFFFENGEFMHLSSLFEISTLMIVKFLILFSNSMTYIDIIILALSLNVFEVKFIKQLYVNEEFLGNEIQNRSLCKVNIFKSNMIYLLIGYGVNSLILIIFYLNRKLSFQLFDDILFQGEYQSICYYFFFIYLSSRKMLNYLRKVYLSQYHYSIITQAKTILFLCLGIQIAIAWIVLSKSITATIFGFGFIIVFHFLYKQFGNITFSIGICYYIYRKLFNWVIENYYNSQDILLLNSNYAYIAISFILSFTFIGIVYYIEYDTIAKTYKSLYERIFIIKVLFDLWLIVNFIYSLYKNNHLNYFHTFYRLYPVVFCHFGFGYICVFLAIYFKLNIVVDKGDVEFYFDYLEPYLNKDNPNYTYQTPYIELKFYKRIKCLLDHFLYEENGRRQSEKALKKISRFITIIIFITFGLIVNNMLLFYIVYLVLVQFLDHSLIPLNKIINYFNNKDFNWVTSINIFNFMRKNQSKTVMQPMEVSEESIKIQKCKFKLIYFYIYPLLVIVWKSFIIKLLIAAYESFLSKLQFVLFGKLEPVTNIIYQFLHLNNNSDSFNLIDIIVLVLFILPNTAGLIYFHLNELKPSFFFQNYILMSLAGIFIVVNPIILVTGILNIFIMLNLFAADEESLFFFGWWFSFFGIQAMSSD